MTNGGLFKSPDLDAPIYSLSDLARVTHLPVGTVRMWLERKILALGKHDIDASGKGSTRQFTLRTVYLAATMSELSRLGVTPSVAAQWAGLLWRDSLTDLLTSYDDMVFIGNPTNHTAHICPRSALKAEEIFRKTVWPGEEDDLSAVLVDASAVARKCRNVLGLQTE
jgi:hypothetical protein